MLRNTSPPQHPSSCTIAPIPTPTLPMEGATFWLTSLRDCREGDFFMPGPSVGASPGGTGSCSML